MDKVKLTDEQLNRVIAYIDGRGFHDQGVIVEILDHFACKVEEKLEQNPKLPFEEAMANAHYDFGVLGFYPLVVAYEKNTKVKYNRIFRAEQKKVLTDPAYIIGAILTGLLVYKGYLVGGNYAVAVGFNPFLIPIMGGFLAGYIFIIRKFMLLKRKSKLLEIIRGRETFIYSLLVSVLIQHELLQHEPYSERATLIHAIIYAVFSLYVIVRFSAMYKTMTYGTREVDLVYDYLDKKKAGI